jgi:hypothetical protein
MEPTRFAFAVLLFAASSTIVPAAEPPTRPSAQSVTAIVIHADEPIGPISPWIYGTNQPANDPPSRYTFVRQGGNRMTAYNWENNASNAGADWHHQNDSFLSESDVPGEVVRIAASKALANGQTFIATVPTGDYVAADKRGDGDVKDTGPDYLSKRFRRNVPSRANAKTTPPATRPDAGDEFVAQDAFVSWLEQTFPATARKSGATIAYALDNEPDIWVGTHARIHPEPITYAELIDRNTRYAAAIKAVAPDALVFGFVSYGWGGFTTLQNAPDRAGQDALDVYLDAMKKAETDAGRRLIDVLDVHWYSEARGGGNEQTGVRISEVGPRAGETSVNEARVQATRSLWDPTYRETSWIDRTLGEPIRLIPRLRAKIDARYPGTKLAFTEYNYGGGENASGAVAQADALGIFGREGVFAAAFWALSDKEPFSRAAFDAYRNYDGHGRTFGETALRVDNGDPAMLGAYASTRKSDGAIVIVLINRSTMECPTRLAIRGAAVTDLGRWQLTGAKAAMTSGNDGPVDKNSVSLMLPAMSVSTIELK